VSKNPILVIGRHLNSLLSWVVLSLRVEVQQFIEDHEQLAFREQGGGDAPFVYLAHDCFFSATSALLTSTGVGDGKTTW